MLLQLRVGEVLFNYEQHLRREEGGEREEGVNERGWKEGGREGEKEEGVNERGRGEGGGGREGGGSE